MNDNQDHFNVLRKIKNKPKSAQRELAKELGFSLGKLNYCLKALKIKGLIKMRNFKKNYQKNKLHLCTHTKMDCRKNQNFRILFLIFHKFN